MFCVFDLSPFFFLLVLYRFSIDRRPHGQPCDGVLDEVAVRPIPSGGERLLHEKFHVAFVTLAELVQLSAEEQNKYVFQFRAKESGVARKRDLRG